MKKEWFFMLTAILFLSACYNYDGPTRLPAPPPTRPKPFAPKPKLTTQEYLNAMAKAIKKQLPSAQVEILQDSIKVLFPDNIQYEKSSTLPVKNVNSELKKLARLINIFNKADVLVTGHTDNSGDAEKNKRISELRAEYIMSVLLAYNAPKDRINAWGLGSSSPISSELSEQGKQNNRRVEFVILASMSDDEDQL